MLDHVGMTALCSLFSFATSPTGEMRCWVKHGECLLWPVVGLSLGHTWEESSHRMTEMNECYTINLFSSHLSS